ncbi:hypothetical protein ACFL0I_01970 [Gemmatimonadota bacterium]
MKNQKVLSIDLGSAYSKIAVRRGWDDETALIHPGDLSDPGGGFVFPSLVVEIKRDGRHEWLIGRDAAAQVSLPGMKIHRYWKNALFGSSGTPTRDDSTEMGLHSVLQGDAVAVAIRFFSELRSALARHPSQSEILGLPVRVGVPKLGSADAVEDLIGHVLGEAGWEPAEGGATVAEPEANLWGLLTRGRNATWVPPRFDFQPWTGRSVSMERMLEDAGFIRVMRRMRGFYRVLVTDVGAYTTDFGFVELDASFTKEDWVRPVVRQLSVELGIRELDQEVYGSLAEDQREGVRTLSTERWDRLKAQLYAGTEIALRNPSGGMLRVGGEGQGEAIASQIAGFAQRVLGARNRFLEDAGSPPIDANVITGGGAMIDALRTAIASGRTGRHDQDFDLYDEDVARSTLERIGRGTEAAVDERVRKNRELIRGAAALGGASVVLG